jgi:hypothetical protein
VKWSRCRLSSVGLHRTRLACKSSAGTSGRAARLRCRRVGAGLAKIG